MLGRRRLLTSLGAAVSAGCLGLGGNGETPTPATPGPPIGSIEVTSPAFEHGDTIPVRFTGDGADVSPPLSIGNIPTDAASLTLIVDDPDAPDPPFTHWLCWAIPPATDRLPEAVPRDERVLDGAIQGENDFGDLGYRGPLPPADDGPHRYRFTVVALETALDLPPGKPRSAVDEALSGSVLDRGRLVGTYDR